LPDEYAIENLRANMAKQEFLDALHVVRRYIGAGDTYQVNYTMKLLFDFHGSAEKFYKVLRRNQSVAYGAYIRNGVERILSFSPELFFRKKGAEITARPMKGTALRGRNSEEEKGNTRYLHNDIKNRSENVMIVDLLRNDLARLMYGHGRSRVFVDSLFDVESYESLLQMTSTVKASTTGPAMESLRLTELFRALFPCGSITGAPKIRTMQIIDELEKSRRGVYTGAIGYFGPDGSAVFNVPIRTVRLQGNCGEMGIGAGITYDSVPEEEWRESLLKGRFLTHAQPEFQIFETLLWQEDQGYWLLAEHLQRLEDAARFFKFSCDHRLVHTYLEEAAKTFSHGCRRVRVILAKDGRLSHSSAECGPPLCLSLPPEPGPCAENDLSVIDFYRRPVDTGTPWRFHKTTMRDLFTRASAEARDQGLYDFIFCNEAGEVTEGSITNIVIYSGGEYKTPPVSCGLLPGVMRGRLLAAGMVPVVEKVLTEQDVRAAQAVFLCNSVRGVIRVRVRQLPEVKNSEPVRSGQT
jgi:para-aminobenzoate synthetase/4-amino-4-deoxychorismate lyase